jgi:GGDEF domain-containing protein
MSLKELFNCIRLRNHRRVAPVVYGIYSAKEFRAILERERARANRNGHKFSLLVFDLAGSEEDIARAQRLVNELKRRVRAIDEIGWFEERRMGIVLPYTAPDGAWKLAADICQMISTKALPPKYTVYTFPLRWMDAGDKPNPHRFAGISQ